MLEGIGISNGMGFTPDHKQMYFTDSSARKIYVLDYDRASGALSNQRVFVDAPEGEGLPDGMTVDSSGDVWSARWGGSALYRYAPDGTVTERIEFPAKKVSSVVFGGDDYLDMYVTTALSGHTRTEKGEGRAPSSGCAPESGVCPSFIRAWASKLHLKVRGRNHVRSADSQRDAD